MDIELTFLGTGTSQGVPVIACPCSVCVSQDYHDKRLRSSVLIRSQNTCVIIDAGPDFRYQMLRANVNKIDAILITHAHRDHVGGLDDIRAYNYVQGKAMDIYAEKTVQDELKQDYYYAFAENKYPGVPEMELHTVVPYEEFRVGSISFLPIRVMHLKLPVIGFRTGRLAYVTDANFLDDKAIENLKNLDVLVLNSLRRDKHISHFSLSESLDIIKILNPKRAYLTHISHQMGFYSELQKELPDGVFSAYDGLCVTV